MLIEVERVAIPVGSTIGFGLGHPVGDPTKVVLFAGDARFMFELGQAVEAVNESGAALPLAEVPDWAIRAILELPEG